MILEDILKFYLTEGTDKQILKKTPYCLMVSLILVAIGTTPTGETFWTLLTLASVIFVLSTFAFERRINSRLGRMFTAVDFKEAIGKITSVYEGRSSLLGDIEPRKVMDIFIVGLANGVATLIVLVGAFLLILSQILSTVDEAIIGILGLIYLVYDISKSAILEPPSDKAENPLGFEFINRYVIVNSLRRLSSPLRSKTLLYVISRLIGPLLHLETPNFAFEAPLVYENAELSRILKELTVEKAEVGLHLEHEEGDSLDGILAEDPKDEKLTVLAERPAREVFPYLLNSSYSYEDKPRQGWTALVIVEAVSKRKVGRIFIHRFRGIFVKTRIRRNGEVEREAQKKGAFQFFMLGERSCIQYLKTQIELNSVKVPPGILSTEVET